MKSPQWASVSFGTLFCLECSGVHRSLGVHITFVRSIAMDSWTDAQLNQMKAGGNSKCAQYITSNGILSSTPIKAKYESHVAQHYKEIIKARTKGLPDPPLPATPKITKTTMASPPAAGGDANGMERLTGETDEQYVARQTRLRDEARVRMAAKFGKGGLGSSNFNAGKKPMAGIGSDSSYDPSRGGYGGVEGVVGDLNVDSIVSGLGSAFATFGHYGRNGIQQASAVLNDQQKLNDLAHQAKTGTRGFWNSISTAANDLAATITEPEEDGLSGLRAHVQHNKSTTSKQVYEGFGGGENWSNATTSTINNVQAQQPSHMSVNKKNDVIGRRTTPNVGRRTPPNVGSRTPPKQTMPMGDDFFASFGT